jgi:hypothetical protein
MSSSFKSPFYNEPWTHMFFFNRRHAQTAADLFPGRPGRQKHVNRSAIKNFIFL